MHCMHHTGVFFHMLLCESLYLQNGRDAVGQAVTIQQWRPASFAIAMVVAQPLARRGLLGDEKMREKGCTLWDIHSPNLPQSVAAIATAHCTRPTLDLMGCPILLGTPFNVFQVSILPCKASTSTRHL